MKKVLAAASLCCLLGLGSHALAEERLPYEGHAPLLKLESVYDPDSGPVDWSRGDITFTRGKTPASQLSAAEIYIVAGAKSSNLPNRQSLNPWADQVFTAVAAYHKEHGSIPALLDEAALRSIPRYRHWLDDALSVYRNPLTGAWPRLDAQQPAPGDVYIRVLSSVEKAEYARLLGTWSVWFGKGSGEKLCSEVFYQRVYGWNGPIYESLPHITCSSQ